MNGLQIAQLAVTLAPVAERLIVEGSKLIMELRKDMTPADMIAALEASKSAHWPEITFGREK